MKIRKKLTVTIASVIGLIASDYATSGIINANTIEKVSFIVMTYLGAQGIADFNKGAGK